MADRPEELPAGIDSVGHLFTPRENLYLIKLYRLARTLDGETQGVDPRMGLCPLMATVPVVGGAVSAAAMFYYAYRLKSFAKRTKVDVSYIYRRLFVPSAIALLPVVGPYFIKTHMPNTQNWDELQAGIYELARNESTGTVLQRERQYSEIIKAMSNKMHVGDSECRSAAESFSTVSEGTDNREGNDATLGDMRDEVLQHRRFGLKPEPANASGKPHDSMYRMKISSEITLNEALLQRLNASLNDKDDLYEYYHRQSKRESSTFRVAGANRDSSIRSSGLSHCSTNFDDNRPGVIDIYGIEDIIGNYSSTQDYALEGAKNTGKGSSLSSSVPPAKKEALPRMASPKKREQRHQDIGRNAASWESERDWLDDINGRNGRSKPVEKSIMTRDVTKHLPPDVNKPLPQTSGARKYGQTRRERKERHIVQYRDSTARSPPLLKTCVTKKASSRGRPRDSSLFGGLSPTKYDSEKSWPRDSTWSRDSRMGLSCNTRKDPSKPDDRRGLSRFEHDNYRLKRLLNQKTRMQKSVASVN